MPSSHTTATTVVPPAVGIRLQYGAPHRVGAHFAQAFRLLRPGAVGPARAATTEPQSSRSIPLSGLVQRHASVSRRRGIDGRPVIACPEAPGVPQRYLGDAPQALAMIAVDALSVVLTEETELRTLEARTLMASDAEVIVAKS